MLPLSKLALISKEDLATVTVPAEDFCAVTLHSRRGKPGRFALMTRGGALPGRRSRVESCWPILKCCLSRGCQRDGAGTFAGEWAFAIIANIEINAFQKTSLA
jgi:hypothetical protein